MANLPLAFGEILVGAIILDAGWKGDSIANVVKGQATQHPLPGSSSGSGGSSGAGGASSIPPGTYTNPVPGARTGRVDQGVDYTLSSRGFLAPGKAKILIADSSNAGWPGGGYIAYQLEDGPLAGAIGYAAENIRPVVKVGETVAAGTQIGTPVSGGTIEAGWASNQNPGQPLAQTISGYGGDQSYQALTAGYSFSRFVQALGGVAGVFSGAGASLAASIRKEFHGTVASVPYG